MGSINTAGIETNVINLSRDVTANEKAFFGEDFIEISFDVDWEPTIIPNP